VRDLSGTLRQEVFSSELRADSIYAGRVEQIYMESIEAICLSAVKGLGE